MPSTEREIVERAAAGPMLDQVLSAWSAINSGSRNLAGLERMAEIWRMRSLRFRRGSASRARRPSRASMGAGRSRGNIPHGRHLHLTVRPTAPRATAPHRAHGHGLRGGSRGSKRRAGFEDGVLKRAGCRRYERRPLRDARRAEGSGEEAIRQSVSDMKSSSTATRKSARRRRQRSSRRAAAGQARRADLRARSAARRNARWGAAGQWQFLVRRPRPERSCRPQSRGRAQRDCRRVGARAAARNVEDPWPQYQPGEDRRWLAQ